MTELLIAVGLVVGVVAAHELGFWLGSMVKSDDDAFDRQVALVRGSSAAVVALLIGFAFSGAASRFIDRLDIIVAEANALGTAYLRADAVAEPERTELKAALKQYAADRAQLLSGERRDQIQPMLAKVGGLHERMWRSALKGAQGNPQLMAIVLPPINEIIDLHTTHLAMARRHLPPTIMAVLLAASATGVGLIGFGNRRTGHRFTLIDSIYGVVLAVALWMTIDLDYPGTGIIQVTNLPIVETLAAMR